MINVLVASLILHITLLRNPQLIVENGIVLRFLILWSSHGDGVLHQLSFRCFDRQPICAVCADRGADAAAGLVSLYVSDTILQL
ncbi:MAG: hypothetical protein ACLSA6_01450 [Holdemania massiliensis]